MQTREMLGPPGTAKPGDLAIAVSWEGKDYSHPAQQRNLGIRCLVLRQDMHPCFWQVSVLGPWYDEEGLLQPPGPTRVRKTLIAPIIPPPSEEMREMIEMCEGGF